MCKIDDDKIELICEFFAEGTPLWAISEALNITEDILEEIILLNYATYHEYVDKYAEDRAGWIKIGKLTQPFYISRGA